MIEGVCNHRLHDRNVIGNLGQKGVAQDPALKPPVEQSMVAQEKRPIVAPSKPPSDANVPKIIEVDLSKLPPDLAKQVQGAIIQGPKK